MSGTVPALVAVDWGTSSFRAGLIDGEGRVIERVRAADGLMAVPDRDFEAVLFRHVGGWLEGRTALPILLSGMIGSRSGWVEVPHVPCPADPARLAAGSAERMVRGHRLVFVSGLSSVDPDGTPDVMRGEEVQIFGALGEAGNAEVILPGTHSKWAWVQGGAVTGFRTYMTGELFAACRHHTILGQLAEGEAEDPEAFLLGVDRGRDDPALGHALFTARTLPLAGRLKPSSVAAYLSGILIGAEFAGALAGGSPRRRVVVGDERLTRLYLAAGARFGVTLEAGPADAAFAGLTILARRLEYLA